MQMVFHGMDPWGYYVIHSIPKESYSTPALNLSQCLSQIWGDLCIPTGCIGLF